MVDRRSKKISLLVFLAAIFVLLVAFTAGWIYRIYTAQTEYSERHTIATVECGRYFFKVYPESVLYENGTLYFEIENTIGASLQTIVVESVSQKKSVDLGDLGLGTVQPVTVDLEVIEWVMVYPMGCAGVNFQNLSFEPRTTT
ncbi:hypothetical protein ACFL3V_07075 [Nanoarchaeota archaeon]